MFLVIQVGEPGVVAKNVPKSFDRCGSYEPDDSESSAHEITADFFLYLFTFSLLTIIKQFYSI